MNSMLVLFHCESNPGYAASSHEHTFLRVAEHFAGSINDVHFAYADLRGGMTPSLPMELTNVLHLDTRWSKRNQLDAIESYVRKHRITRLLGFDQPVSRPMYKALRRGGIHSFVSYWGAPMSSLNSGVKLLLKRIEVSLRRDGPDHYIFQSIGMRETAIRGRGIPKSKTSVVKSGIDCTKFFPDPLKRFYAHECFSIPKNRKIVVFSGHMERRKGVHVILETAIFLTQQLNYNNVHFLIIGNNPGEDRQFLEYLRKPEVMEHVTFGGYRYDIPDILKSCSLGMIASVEWDSFPMSSLEMAATGLPLIVSDLPGLNEAITDETGFHFPVNDHVAAAKLLNRILPDTILLQELGKNGRKRVLKHYSRDAQANGIIEVFSALTPKVERFA